VGFEHAVRDKTGDAVEIEDVLTDHRSVFRRNLPGRAATHLADGRTAAGRHLVVAFIYRPATRTAVPINAWEKR
jgi:hypothetical protein